jgi:hypothetical protein
VLVHHDTDLYDLQIRDHGKTSVIGTTSNHLFYVAGAGGNGGRWVKAGALKYGTHLRTPGGSDTATVTGGWVPPQRDGWMWDLTIPGNNDHDFYIDAMADVPVLVHNDCSLPRLDSTGKVHGQIPSYVPESMTSEQMEEMEADLQQSIATRQAEQEALGEDPAHRARINEELRFLRQIQKPLNG